TFLSALPPTIPAIVRDQRPHPYSNHAFLSRILKARIPCEDQGMDVELVAVTVGHKQVMTNLLQLYLHDFSGIRPAELSAQGTFDYPWLSSVS
ncbi:hypothetical protein, partial [Streptomyces sp. NPDC018000]|uniref:hypothetical protein n=1 Tax=Streptomyces sp. NPDC018000 TaxID=3365028 RepID=UPI0037B85B58